MVSCAACGCSQTPKNKSLGITFHSFPKDAQRRQVWINFMSKSESIPKSNSVLCSNHFTKECFDRTSQQKVRLCSTALPTIEVDRLKHVRTYNPVHFKPMKCTTPEASQVENLPPADNDIVDVPGPSRLVRTPVPIPAINTKSDEMEQDTPGIRSLKRKISELSQRDILKSHKIRKLQKITWRQKQQISSLKTLAAQLKKQNLILKSKKISC